MPLYFVFTYSQFSHIEGRPTNATIPKFTSRQPLMQIPAKRDESFPLIRRRGKSESQNLLNHPPWPRPLWLLLLTLAR